MLLEGLLAVVGLPLPPDSVRGICLWWVSRIFSNNGQKSGFEQLLERTARWPGQPKMLLEGLLAVVRAALGCSGAPLGCSGLLWSSSGLLWAALGYSSL